VCHEVVGHIVHPYGPDVFGGPVGWHAFGLLIIAVGLALLLAVFRRARRFLIGTCAALIPVGAGIFLYTWLSHGDFHLFALTGVLAACGLIGAQAGLRDSPGFP
jgi:hypothetical protein